MNLAKTSLLNGVAVVVRMLTLLGINKLLAVYVGPSGYVFVGQFQNAVQMITTLAGSAINNGVTKYTAEYYKDESKQQQLWQTAGTISILVSAFASIIIAILNHELSELIFNDPKYNGVFLWFAVALVPFTLNTLLMAILNGKKDIKRYVVANIAGSCISLAITSTMAVKFGLYGALVALAIYQSVTFFATYYLCRSAPWFKYKYLFGHINNEIFFSLGKYALMALISAICVPLSHIVIRTHLSETLGYAAAGYWEAVWRLSGAYLMLVTSTLSVYYLPRLSELQLIDEIKKEILSGYKLIIPITVVCSTLIYLLRDIIIELLFTSDFSPMRDLFGFQMIGDALKIASWILAYLMLSKTMLKLFIATEILFSASFVLLTVLLTSHYGIEGVAIAHAINYGIYWLVLILCMKYKFKMI
jgi:polysaccharide transporter, PST family